MKYMGSKNRHAKELLPIILKDRQPKQWYVEPFVGGFNMIDKVKGLRLANDSHYYLTELFKAIQRGWIPPSNVSELDYLKVRDHKDAYAPQLIGFVGFGCTYSGKWFGGYARSNRDNGTARNHADESKRNILKQAEDIAGIKITNMDYRVLFIPPNSIIYCDPPYANVTEYRATFNYEAFWTWVRKMHIVGHQIFVSEYSAPDDFECVWSKKTNNTLVQNTGSKQGVEKLFKIA